jgi:peptidoglycan L-alanyl-D-glutamate endopeptidase CwlK
MPRFGKQSQAQLDTCHEDLQKVLNVAIKEVDFSILEGHRSKELQDKYFRENKSKLKYPLGKHNKIPSLAVDIAPYPIDWKDTKRFAHVAFFIKGIAYSMGIRLRLGGDWNGDFINNESFIDLPHLELSSKLVNGKWVKY